MQNEEANSLDNAVSRLLKEPESEQSELVSPEVEPEVEQEETEVEETEVESELEEEGEPESSEYEEETEEVETEEEGEELDEPSYVVKIDGEEYEVTLEELQSGYQRQKDYTKKTQAIAEQRKAIEERQQELAKAHEDFMSQATLANELLNRDLKKYESVDWDTLKTEDPVGYVQKQIEVQDLQKQQAQLHEQAQQVQVHNQKVQQEQLQEFVENEQKETLRLFPDWNVPEKAQANQAQIVEYARSIGYKDEELATIVKAKDLLVLDKARRYDELSKTKQNITKKRKPAIKKLVKSKGAAPKSAPRKRKLDEARGQLRKSGSIKDAAAFMYERQQGQKFLKK